MKDADTLFDESGNIFNEWGLSEIPFTESAVDLGQNQLRRVFTGRETELRQVFNLVRGRDRKRIFIYGWIGIRFYFQMKALPLKIWKGSMQKNSVKFYRSWKGLFNEICCAVCLQNKQQNLRHPPSFFIKKISRKSNS